MPMYNVYIKNKKSKESKHYRATAKNKIEAQDWGGVQAKALGWGNVTVEVGNEVNA